MTFFSDPNSIKASQFDTVIDEKSITILENAYTFLKIEGLNPSSIFYNFPIETCFFSSWFVACYFTSINCEPLQWIFGSCEKYGGHVWLESQDYTIDLTYGQFNSTSRKFLFYKKSSSKIHFHNQFEIIDKGYFGDNFKTGTKYALILDLVNEFQKSQQ